MTDRLPRSINLPEPPRMKKVLSMTPGGAEKEFIDITYARKLNDSLRANHHMVAERVEELINAGLDAEKPDATGAGKIFYATDTNILYIDDSAWHAAGGVGYFLPLSAGSGYPLTGNLYIDGATSPTLLLREGGSGTSYSRVYEVGNGLYLRKHELTGNTGIYLDPMPTDGAGDSTLGFFRSANTTGSRRIYVYQGDGTETWAHRFEATGNVNLCHVGGSVTLDEGDLFLNKAADPTIKIQEGGGSTGYLSLADVHETIARIRKVTTSGQANLELDAMPLNATSPGVIKMFLNTNTSGSVSAQVYKGDGTSTLSHTLWGHSASADFCYWGGEVNIHEGNLFLNKTSAPTLFLRTAGSTTSYSSLFDESSGEMRMQKVTASGTNALMTLDPMPAGNDIAAFRVFRLTTTTGATQFQIFKGDGTSTVAHSFRGDNSTADVCQAGGNFSSLGNFWCGKAATPSLFLAEGDSGTDYTQFHESGGVSYWRKVAASGSASQTLDPIVSDGTGIAEIRMFRTTNTSGSTYLVIYPGDGTSYYEHIFRGHNGNVNLCARNGKLAIGSTSTASATLTVTGNATVSSTFWSGSTITAAAGIYAGTDVVANETLKSQAASNPDLVLAISGSTTNYTRMWDNGSDTLSLIKHRDSGDIILDIYPSVGSGTHDGAVRFFKTTNTTGARTVELYKGNGTATIQHSFNCGTGDVSLCKDDGSVTVEGDGIINIEAASGSSYLTLNAGGSAVYSALLSQYQNVLKMQSYNTGGPAYIRIAPIPNSTSEAAVYYFVSTNTSGSVFIDIKQGDGTTSSQHTIYGSSGNVELSKLAGDVSIGSASSQGRLNFINTVAAEIQFNGSSWVGANGYFAWLGRAAYPTHLVGSHVLSDAPASDPGTGVMDNGTVVFYLDESGNNLKVRVQYSGGTNKTGTVCALA